ncbi:hypothetical protein HCG51_31880 [Tolypothrix sp. PCC 7910]|uniref:hypothetical protein n=1 Tax=Tolypothrix sp. PCC 7910 TaxID=2099387 RepID=UPI0014277FB2|nr:hypothetical protein [Tolypothrix sp. PCC 7910]QIR40834.1 hypothetical protein HCG51_31880 [Tolypothrix sp. PCC 7910]
MKAIKADTSIKSKENSKIMQLVELTEISDQEMELVVGGTDILDVNASVTIAIKPNSGVINDVISAAWTSTGGGSTGGSGGGSGGSGGW